MEEPVERIEDCDGKQLDCLIQRICDLMSKMHQVLVEKILQYDQNQRSDHRCFACVTALFLMANKCLVDGKPEFNRDGEKVKKHFRDMYRTIDLDNFQWTREKTYHTESDLWTLAAMREVGDDISYVTTDQRFLDCIEGLERHNSPALGLMLWLFPEFVTEERLMRVESITRNNYAWLMWDRMLFWLACMRYPAYSQAKVRDIEEQILRLQLDTNAFATVEGKNEKGDLISSAIGLLVLISCIGQNNSKNLVLGAAMKTASWIVDQLGVNRFLVAESSTDGECTDVVDSAWVFYVLSQYMIRNQIV